ncbi:MAG TPA: hypothetical protein PK264_17940, partial [Hyphomicrobiaceae bacterium]|nr:hypothetical protein [Hyphomicrobiaceae bacterium]
PRGSASADDADRCALGDAITCMLVEKRKASAGTKSAAPAGPTGPAAVAPPKVAVPSVPPIPAGPKVADASPPKPVTPPGPGAQPADPKAVDKSAPPSAAASDAGATPAKTKRYIAPAYGVLSSPVAPLKVGGQRQAFVVESVECSDEGNWIVGYLGFLTATGTGDTGDFVIRQRYAINNYPEEGRLGLGEVKKMPGVTCSADQAECSAPRRRISLVEFKRLKTSAPADPKAAPVPKVADKTKRADDETPRVQSEWRCDAGAGMCFSRERDTWRCDASTGRCMSYDAARWWCVPRREFCSQRVPFGDWGSPLKEGDRVKVGLKPRGGTGGVEKDANGHPIYDLHVYDMAHPLVTIAADVLTRRCAGHKGPARDWKANLTTN